MESNTYMVAGQTFELKHYGVKGMKWGKRRAVYYNKRADRLDRRANTNRVMGSMNAHAAKNSSGLISKANRINASYYQKRAGALAAKAKQNRVMATDSPEGRAARKQNAIRCAKIGGAAVAAGLAVYGAKTISDYVNLNRNARYVQNFLAANDAFFNSVING